MNPARGYTRRMTTPGAHDWPRPDWTPVQPFPFTAARHAFAGMTADEGRVLLKYYLRPDKMLVATAAFGPRSEGAPGLVHGGAILTVLDEALGAAAWVTGRPVMTASLETDFRKAAPLGTTALIETRLLGERHRLVRLDGTLTGPDGVVYARAEGRFMRLSEDAQRRILGRTV